MNINEEKFNEEKEIDKVLENSILKIRKMSTHYKFMFFVEIVLYLIGACLLELCKGNLIATICGALFIAISVISTITNYIINVLLVIEVGYLKTRYKSAESLFYLFLVGLFLIFPTLISCFAIKKFYFFWTKED
ncbi:MAG: hypothetical protein K2O21_00560 [Malacoplasma sp.]|nr:hypothetical protein [Malacoplasma sp.]